MKRFLIISISLLIVCISADCINHSKSSGNIIDKTNYSPYLEGVQGFGQEAVGGKGGQILIVSNLNPDGEGSLAEAIHGEGPRIIVFDVAGVIDLEDHSLRIENPFITIAGQTAPSPGITLIKGGLKISTHEVIIQNLKVRPGEAGKMKASGWEADGISTSGGAYNVIIDHCSCTWATDENLSVSGPRFNGENPADWRNNTSHKVTVSNCIIANGLSLSTHEEVEHSKGSLIHDNTTEVLIYGNLYANNLERNPLCKGGSQTAIINNLIYNPGRTVIHYALNNNEWKGHDLIVGKMSVKGNCIEYGPNTAEYVNPIIFLGLAEVYWNDNKISNKVKYKEAPREFRRRPQGQTLSDINLSDTPPIWPEGLVARHSDNVEDFVLENAGAFYWDRDSIDKEIISGVKNRTGKIIDSETEAGGYPNYKVSYRKFNANEWDLNKLSPKN